MRVRLTNAFYDGIVLHPVGTELNLPVPPKSAIVLPAAEEPEPELPLTPSKKGK